MTQMLMVSSLGGGKKKKRKHFDIVAQHNAKLEGEE